MSDTSVRDLIRMDENIPTGFLVIRCLGEDMHIETVNTRLAHICGYADQKEMLEETHASCRNLIHPWDLQGFYEDVQKDDADGFGRHYFHLRLKNGDYIYAEGVEMRMRDPEWGPVAAINIVPDEEKENRNAFDDVTALPRQRFLNWWIDRHRQNIEDSADPSRITATVCINVVGFRALNEAGGIRGGDAFLKEFGQLLVRVFDTRLITRNFADYFTVYYMGSDVVDRVEQLEEEVQSMRKGFHLDIEAGIYQWNRNVSAEESMAHAESALHSIERGQKPPYCIYSDAFAAKEQKRHYIETHFEEAVKEGRIEVWLQPLVRALTGKISAFEALSRWRDPVYGMISPGEFVPVLEQTGQSWKLASYVIDKVAVTISDFRSQMHRISVPVSLNLSRRDFDAFDPAKAIRNAVEKYDLEPDQIFAEITESTVMENPDKVREVVDHLHEAGFQVWMDDFGSAYSSLNVLKDFSFDLIKLDMAFLHGLNSKGRAIIRDCISLAKNVGIQTLCEGVENEGQLTFLKDAGCDFIQGYYFSRPLPAEEVREKILKGQFILETREEGGIYETVSPMPFPQNTSWCIFMADHGKIRMIYESRDFRQKISGKHLIRIPETGLLSSDGSGMMPSMYNAMNRAARSAETTMEEYQDGTELYEVTARPLSWIEKERGLGVCIVHRKAEDAGLPYEAEGRIFNAYAEDPIPLFIAQFLPGSTPAHDDVEFLYCNEAYCHLLGKRRTDIVGHKFRSISQTRIDSSWVSVVAKCAWSRRKIIGRKFSSQNLHMLEYLAVPLERRGCVAFSMTIDDGTIDYENGMFSLVPDDDNMVMHAAVISAIREDDPVKSISVLLASVGKDLGADRTYIFEFEDNGDVSNTYEWCRDGVEAEKDNLQHIPHAVYEKTWGRHMEHHQSIIIRNMDEYDRIDPNITAILRPQKIDRLAVVPLFAGEKQIGFAGIDNPPLSSIRGIERHLEIFAEYIAAFLENRSRKTEQA